MQHAFFTWFISASFCFGQCSFKIFSVSAWILMIVFFAGFRNIDRYFCLRIKRYTFFCCGYSALLKGKRKTRALLF